MATRKRQKLCVGALELCDLPDLGISNLHVRVDTGAATSSLHVDNIERFKKGRRNMVSFDLHPDIHNVDRVIRTTAPVDGRKTVKSSSADTESRVVITTTIRLGSKQWPIKLNLTDRSGMTYLMLLGRQAMEGRIIVDPEFDYMLEHEFPEDDQDSDLEDSEEE